jgi:hypothetical protein
VVAALPTADGVLPVDGPAMVAALAKVAMAAGELPPEPDVGLATVAAGAEPPPVAVDVWVTGVVPAVVGAVVVLVVSDGLAATDPLGFVGTVVVVALICWSNSSEGFDPPLPVGTVVVGAGAAVAGAAVVGVAAGATVVTGLAAALLVEVPWDWVPAAVVAGAVSAEAGPECSTRKRPARSAKDATHLRGRTTSILVLALIGLNRPPSSGLRARRSWTSAGTREVNHGATGRTRDLGPPDLGFWPCWSVLEGTNGSRWKARRYLAPPASWLIHKKSRPKNFCRHRRHRVRALLVMDQLGL